MASIIYFLKNYNNYYNRIIKKSDSIDSYLQNAEDSAVRGDSLMTQFGSKGPVNFNINDGVTAQATYNYDPSQTWQPDYIIKCSLDNEIESRWFVLEAKRTRKGQYVLTLRRDVIADNMQSVLNSPCFIERGYVPYDDNFIFNSEGISYNQIKDENETLLKDHTGCAWIVGYVASPEANEEDTEVVTKYQHDIDFVTPDINAFTALYGGVGTHLYYNPNSVKLRYTVEGENSPILGVYHAYNYTVNVDGTSTNSSYKGIDSTCKYKEGGSASTVRYSLAAAVRSEGIQTTMTQSVVRAIFNNNNLFSGQTSVESLLNLNNKFVKDSSDNKFYRITAILGSSSNLTTDITSSSGSVYNAMANIASNAFNSTGHGNNEYFKAQINSSDIKAVFFDVDEVDEVSLEIKSTIKATRRVLRDAPYCMFAIPYGAITLHSQGGDSVTSGDIGMAMARGIVEVLTKQKCYDLQLLPYCPINDYKTWLNPTTIDLQTGDLVEGQDFSLVNIVGGISSSPSIILWARESNFTIDIPVNISIENSSESFKIENETSFYRLCSPNYSGAFEFNVAKNGGSVTSVNVDCAYKPYSPYIHANINFSRIYGSDTNDTRGLICGGDFSLPQTSDQWANYLLNNKNYQASFDKQIETMDKQHTYEMQQKAIVGSLSALGVGAGVSGVTGPIGGAAAGIASTAALGADLYYSEKTYQTSMGNTKAQFEYSLDNVKARPNTLSTVGAYNDNNKIFLFIEHYKASESEIDALKMNIKYRGFSIGKIGNLEDYIVPEYNYVRGEMIRLENLSDDYHMSSEIANEIKMGVFIYDTI